MEPTVEAEAPVLDYRQTATEDTFRDKGWWVAAAAGVMAALALAQQGVNFALYFFPGTFASVTSGMGRPGATNVGMLLATLVSTGLSLAMLVSAAAYLFGRDARRALVVVAALQILFGFAASSYAQYTFFNTGTAADRAIHFIWLAGSIVQDALLPALVIVFFHRRAARPTVRST